MNNERSRFNGLENLFGSEVLKRLKSSHIAVVGIGGVGSWTAEALARSGVGEITLIDLDEICITNTNRQLHTMDSTIGKSKVLVMKERLKSINPQLVVHAVEDFITEKTIDSLISKKFDGVVDAIDSLSNKCLLIKRCHGMDIPIVTTGGAGGKMDPSQILVDDLANSSNDMLLMSVKKEMRRYHGYPAHPELFNIRAVFSNERAVFKGADGKLARQKLPTRNVRLDCSGSLGSASFVTGSFGFIAAAEIIKMVGKVDV